MKRGHDPGSWLEGYSQAEYDAVVRVVRRHVGPENRTTFETITSDPTLDGISPRMIRQIMSDADGREFLLCQDDRGDGVIEGVYVCAFQEQGEKTTKRYEQILRTYQDKVERRRGFSAGLPRFQGWLFDD